jgi:cyclic beta-1,2-glucan synthetase
MARFGPGVSLAELPDRCAAALLELAGTRERLVDRGEGSVVRLRQIDALASAIERSAAATAALGARLETIAAAARAMVAGMDFRFLFDPSRMLFSIGYRMSDRALDDSRYDMLASEARLLSFIAIAKGDVPSSHWFRLGRLLTPVRRDSVLMSWAGSMFEYLMPALVLRTPMGSLLEQTCRLVVQRQMDYGEERGVPWGISESGYFARDLGMNFQYSTFGVPGLGLRRGLADDIVVAPYATALAALFDPAGARRNLTALAAQGGDGAYGFYEAIDYTPSRLPEGATHEVVRAYMAHHQGMTIVAIGNALHGGVMQDRFHAEPMVRATELLLQERTPRDVPVARPRVDAALSVQDVRELVSPRTRHFTTPQTAAPRTQLLSNGRYAVMITAAGSGYSRWRDIGVTRWRPDATSDDLGAYLFLRDAASGERWSAGFQPTGAAPEAYDVSFTEDRAEFVRRDGAITTRLEVIVSSEDDAEVRRVSITNSGARPREIDVTSYAEIVLAPPAADHAHPAFSNLFIETEVVPDLDTLLATRRPRSAEDREIWLAHVLAVEGETVGDLQWETDRAQFLGRGRHVRSAVAEADAHDLSNTTGAVLDPIVSLRRRVRIRPGRTVHVAFSTLVAATRAEALDLADKYHDVTTFERAATLAWTQAQVQLHHLGIDAAEAHLFQTLAGSILYADRAMGASATVMARRTGSISSLWVHGISGDLPVVLVKIDAADDVGIVRQLLRAHAYWRMKRLAVDLVILNDRAPSYLQDLQTLLDTLVRASQSTTRPEAGMSEGRVFAMRSDQMTVAQQDMLESVARVVVSSRRGSLAEQVQRSYRADGAPVVPTRTAPAVAKAEDIAGAAPPVARDLEFANGMGGFDAGGSEYVIALRPGEWTPAPWINVLANPGFGALVSESGSGCTWCENSQANQLTTWSNDPVCDPPGDMLYVRDEDSGDLWTATPLPIREANGEYVARHGHGYSRHSYDAHGIALDLLQFVPAADPIKVARLVLTNHSDRARRLSVTGYLEWVLGTSRGGTAPFVSTEIDAATGAMLARNSWSADFGARVAFADLGGAQTAFTGDRTEFLGRNGTAARPLALTRREKMSGRTGATYDPCAALQTTVDLAPGAHATVVFFLGQADSEPRARELVQRWRAADLDAELQEVTGQWERLLNMVQVRTPDRALDVMLNQWLLYQTLASRVWARTGFYQASGAYGFRDQLQDVMALALGRPDLTRAQIVRAAARQFKEGDVQHWWHEPTGRGVRTRIVDDLLWLPFVTDHYLAVTGDRALLDEQVPFIRGPLLTAGQTESYFEPRVSSEQATVYEHCARAIDRSLEVGAHGLPLMGTGDWNDGMSRVGVAGKGESVWMAWFLCDVLAKFAPVAAARGEAARADAWRAAAKRLAAAAEHAGWDGSWYRRAYFDDGTPLGTRGADACAIDSIAQSWAVISGAAPRDRARLAMQSLDERLVHRDEALILLLTPPFDHTTLEPGYIKGYVPGVRENGGQYTHAAAWAIIAFAELGDGGRAAELMAMLNPIHRSAATVEAQRYRIEPYVVPGDVYAAPHAGRGGWSWYTGSAGWLYRAGIEWMLGLRVRAGRLTVDPCIPRTWPGFSMTYRSGEARYEITVENPHGVSRGVCTLELDGAAVDRTAGIALATSAGARRVRVLLGPAAPAP